MTYILTFASTSASFFLITILNKKSEPHRLTPIIPVFHLIYLLTAFVKSETMPTIISSGKARYIRPAKAITIRIPGRNIKKNTSLVIPQAAFNANMPSFPNIKSINIINKVIIIILLHIYQSLLLMIIWYTLYLNN